MAKKDADKPAAPADKTEPKAAAKPEPAKVDVKAVAASDGRVDAKFDEVKSGGVEAPALAPKPSSDAPRAAPVPGDGPKSATQNELPTEIARPRTSTDRMSAVTPIGEPPQVPTPKSVEDPTHMPGPRNIPGGNPTDPALPPGHVPPGDSRSLRRGDEFALVYRQGSSVITRWGTIGQRGQWRVVEYPTVASASSSYAKECSRFVGEGFSDYRDQ